VTFDEASLAALCQRLNESEVFQAAATKAGSFLLLLGERAVFLRIAPGRCEEARLAREGEGADFVIEASEEALEKLARRELDVTAAFMKGELRLKKGSLFGLLPYAQAAKAIFDALA